MKLRYASVVLFLLFPSLLLSQANLNSAPYSASADAAAGQGRQSQGQMLSLNGKVTTEDGSRLGERAAVILECAGSERGRVNSDNSGDFAMSVTLIENDPGSVMQAQSTPRIITAQDWNQCELYADAPGYTSEHLRMFGAPEFGVVQVGTVIMHLMVRTNGATPSIDVASLAAPEKAKKAFEKGEEQARKGKWQAACDYFRKAVEVYPRYALAWLELGRTQVRQKDFNGAQQSFQQATQRDPHLVDGFVEIARIAADQHQWKQMADATGHLVELAPEATPRFWFLNSAANFNLGEIPRAETSAARGLRMDSKHEVPELEYLYGMIMARRGDYKSAISHISTYLQLSPDAAGIADAQAKLAELQKLADAQPLAKR